MKRHNRPRFEPRSPGRSIAKMVGRAGRGDEQTNAEATYLAQLIQNKTPVTVKLVNDEEISGWVEYYDRTFIRVTRDSAPNVFIFKDQIKLIIEGSQNQGRRE
jgi:sRNA-binding regulator protein Hfq